MNKFRQRLLSIFLALSFVLTMFGGVGSTKAEAAELNKDKIRSLLLERKITQTSKEEAKKKLAEKLGQVAPEGKDGETKPSSKLNPNENVRIIVQLKEAPAVEKDAKNLDVTNSRNASRISSAVKSVKDSQASIISQVEKITGSKVRRSYGYLVNGFSVTGKRSDIPKIAAINGVKTVTEAKVYYTDMKFANGLTQVYSVWEELNYKGEGMVVAIVDTGIDPSHKDLKLTDISKAKLTSMTPEGPGKYYTPKVPYGYNFADNNYEIVDKNPNTSMHGMHVAGIVAANGDDAEINSLEAVKGVAPEAQLLAMKVFSNSPDGASAYTDDIIAAMEDSVLHGADVINMSLGSDNGFTNPEDPELKAVKNATDNGVLVVISSGNAAVSSTDDSWNTIPTNLLGLTDTATIGSPGTAEDALTVASYENADKIFNGLDYKAGDVSGVISYMPGDIDPLKVLTEEYELVECGLGSSTDFKDKDLRGKIALIERGGSTFTEKSVNAQNAGAIGVIIYNSVSGGDEPFGMSLETSVKIPVASVGRTDGLLLKDLISKGVRISFNGKISSLPSSEANDMSPYTSWGPTPSLEMKPEITAPGGDIYSLKNDNGYQTMSGTSMSAPHVAGAEALIIQALKERNLNLSGRALVEFAKKTSINTAKVQIDKHGSSLPYSPRRQGAGMIQIKDAINNNVILTYEDGNAVAALKEIGDTKSFVLTLKNYGDTAVTYNLEDSGVLSEKLNWETVQGYKVSGAELSFDSTSVTVPAKGEAKVKVTLKLPKDFKSDNFVEGFIYFKSVEANIPSLVMPYMGFYGKWDALQIIDKPIWEDSKFDQYMSEYYSSGYGMKIHYGSGTSLAAISSGGHSIAGLYYDEGPGGKYDYDFGSVDPDSIAFSPNNDGSSDMIAPYIYMLRNAKEKKVQVLDENKRVLTTLSLEENVRKNLLEEAFIYGTEAKLDTNAIWDGTVYDSEKGTYVAVPEGQYYIRLTAKADVENAEVQVIDMPVKVDLKEPELNITSSSSTNSTRYVLTWTAKEDLSGMDYLLSPIIYVNGSEISDSEYGTLTFDGTTYRCTINLQANRINTVEIGMLDYAGNLGYTFKAVEVRETAPVEVYNLLDGLETNQSEYEVFGLVRGDVEAIKINGVDAAILGDGTFYGTVELQDGYNTVTVASYDSSNKELSNESYRVRLDTASPKLVVNSPSVFGGLHYTDKNKITVSGNVEDDNLYSVKINGKSVSIDPSGNFTQEIAIKDIHTLVYVEALDRAGNISYTDFTVVYEGNTDPFEITFHNLDSFMALNEGDTKDDVYTIEGHVNHKTSVFTINDVPVEIKRDLTFSVPIKLEQGDNKVRIYAEDEMGRVVYNYAYKIYYDSVAPKLVITEPLAHSDGKVYTNKDQITVKGEVSDNTFGYQLFINGNAVMVVDKYPETGEGSNIKQFEYTVPVKNGSKLVVTLVDQFNNVTESIMDIVVDKIGPKAPVISADVDLTKPTNKDITLTITSEDPTDRIEYSLDKKTWLPYTQPVKIVANGTVYARATDLAGNKSLVSSVEINVIDKISPVITVIGVEDGGVYNSSVKAFATSNEGSVTMKLNGNEYKGEDITEEGQYELIVQAVDAAGNLSKRKISFTIDRTGPVITVEGVEDGKSYNTAVTPKITSNEGDLTITLNGKEYNGEEITEEGQYELEISAVDRAGNTSERKIKFSIDKTAPVIKIEGVENGKTYNNSASAKISVSEGTFTAFLDGMPFEGGKIYASGQHELKVAAQDAAGNTTEVVVNFNIKALVGKDSNASKDFGESVKNSPEQNVEVELDGTTVVDDSFFEAIYGVDKNIIFKVGSGTSEVIWTFNGKNFNKKNIRDVELALNVTSRNRNIISKIDENAQIISFKHNGVLPGPAVVKIKLDPSKIDVTKGVYFYYYDSAKRTAVPIAGPLTPDKDGYVEVTITHCSDYFFSNLDNAKVAENVKALPKTGAFLDSNILFASGLLLAALGTAFIIINRRKRSAK